MIGIEVRGSPLLHRSSLQSVPDEQQVVFIVPHEHPEFWRHHSYEGSSSSLSLRLPPVQFILIWRYSSGYDNALGVQYLGLASGLLL